MTSEEFKNKLVPMHQKLYRLCYRFLGTVADAEDAIQEVYIKLWNMRDKLTGIQNIEAFSTTVTKNYCLDRLKLKKNVSMDDLLANTTIADHAQSPLAALENRENSIFVKQIINTLPDQQQSIIIMRDIEEYSFDEIQSVTGLDINNIRVNLSRARKQVRNELIKFHYYGTERNKKTAGKIL
jgi:RNA polymerase sigma-70 factor (ECF subfamily)